MKPSFFLLGSNTRVWNFMIIGILCVVLMRPISAYAVNILSDNELAFVGAGSAGAVPDPTSEQLSTSGGTVISGGTTVTYSEQSGQSGSTGFGNRHFNKDANKNSGKNDQKNTDVLTTAHTPVRDNIIVVGASRATVYQSGLVLLEHNAQRNLVALNVSNSVYGDAINGLNMHVRGSNSNTWQLNESHQQFAGQAFFGGNTPLISETLFSAFSEHSSHTSSSDIGSNQNALFNSWQSNSTYHDVEIPPLDASNITFDIDRTIIPSTSFNLIPALNEAIKVNKKNGEGKVEVFSVSVKSSGLTINGPSLSVTGIRPVGNDLVLSMDFKAPAINPVKIEAEACILCGVEGAPKFDWGFNLGPSIGGGDILTELKLEGLNPLSNLDLNLNSGIATAGKGRFSGSGSSAKIYGEVEVDLWADVKFDLNLPKDGWFNKHFGNRIISSVDERLSYNIKIPFTILDDNKGIKETTDGFSLAFEGSLCVDLGLVSPDCGKLEYASKDFLFSDNSLFTTSSSSNSSDYSFSESNQYQLTTAGLLTGGQAEYIVMADSELNLMLDSDVTLTDNAQQNMQTLSVLNGAASVAANGVNMETGGASGLASSISHIRLNQTNKFNQRM